jgi:hypothetical protein
MKMHSATKTFIKHAKQRIVIASNNYKKAHGMMKAPSLLQSSPSRQSLNLDFLQTDDIKYICMNPVKQPQCLVIHYVDNTYDEIRMCDESDITNVYNLILNTLKNQNQYIEM